MNTLEYKGYVGKVFYSDDDECFYITVEGIKDGLISEAQEASEIKVKFAGLIDGYLSFCEEKNKIPEQQASGHF